MKLLVQRVDAFDVDIIEDPAASEYGEYFDDCFECGQPCPPTRLVMEPPWTRSFHSCEANHEERTHADWWTDRKGSEVMERVALFFPEKGDGGTTWSGVPIYSTRHSGDVELQRRSRRSEQAAPATPSPRPESQRGERREAKKGLTSRVGGFMIAAVIYVVFGWLAWTLLTAPSCLESEHYTYEECMGTESDDHYGMP